MCYNLRCMRGSVRLHERLIISQTGFDSRLRNQDMARFKNSPESGFITRLLTGRDGVNNEFEVVIKQPWDGEVWTSAAKDERVVSDYREGPWGFVADRQAGEERIRRSEIFVYGVISGPTGYVVVDNVIDIKGETKFYVDEF